MSDAKHRLETPWYHGVTRYQWLVLIIASAGWIFDAFEGQIYNITQGDMLPQLLKVPAGSAEAKAWNEHFKGIFLLGSTFGGLLFSSLADRWGRKPVMNLTILFYSVFTGLTAFADQLWQVGTLRFLVAMGVGGEWAVGAALVAEVFPAKARARAGGLFHASSVLGTSMAAGVGLAVGEHWRIAYLIGVVPALLVLWVRVSVKEPESWEHAKQTKSDRLGSFSELLGDSRWRSRAIFGALLAMVGLTTFWSVVVAGQNLAEELLLSQHVDPKEAASRGKIAYGFIQTAGAAVGMLCFGPLSVRFGRRATFAMMHVCAFVVTVIVCWVPFAVGSYGLLLCLLPFLGFFGLAIHAGYAVYFPELFPTHLRATGAGFCFNGGRAVAALAMIFVSSPLKKTVEDLNLAITLLAGFFLLGLVFLCFLPETKDKELPD